MSLSSNDSAACFYKFLSEITAQTAGLQPCRASSSPRDYVNCCHIGDYCLEDNICRFTHSTNDGISKTGFYTSGCTDSTYQDSTCSQHCVNSWFRDITYNTTANLWACCDPSSGSNDSFSCEDPSDETWQAAPGSALATLALIPSSGPPSPIASTYTPATSTTSTTSPTTQVSANGTTPPSAATSTPNAPNDGLNTGAKVGVGVGVAIGVLAIFAIVASILFRGRGTKALSTPVRPLNDGNTTAQSRELQGGSRRETVPYEIQGREVNAELSNWR